MGAAVKHRFGQQYKLYHEKMVRNIQHFKNRSTKRFKILEAYLKAVMDDAEKYVLSSFSFATL